jgi:DNA polymerase-3 subunit delta
VKLAGAEAARALARPEPGPPILLHGTDPMRVALKRQALVAGLIGPEGAAEMRLTRLHAGELRRDPAAALDALKARGFFPGPRVVLVEEANDAAAAPLAAAARDWRPGDATLVVTAGELRAAGALRKAFEADRRARALAIHADPPGREEIAAAAAAAGLALDRAAAAELEALGRGLDPGDFAQFLAKLALYKRGDPAPVSPADLAATAPPAPEAEAEALIDLAAEGRAEALAAAMLRLGGGSAGATGLVIAAGRRLRALHAAAVAPDGPEAALGRARPPVFGPRRARLAAQARALGAVQIERALGFALEADLALRSARPPPALALAERLLVRIATLERR